MPQPLHHRPLTALFSAGVLLLLAAGCSGSDRSPTAAQGPQASLQTQWGTATVFTNGNNFDAARASAAIERAYSQAREQVGSSVDSISLDGLGISVRPGPFDGAVGEYHSRRDLIEMAQGIENVLTHELQHRFCHQLGNSGSCCTLQDHPNGFDLRCQPR